MRTKFCIILMAFTSLILLGSATCGRDKEEPIPANENGSNSQNNNEDDNGSNGQNNNEEYVGAFFRKSYIDYYLQPDKISAELTIDKGKMFSRLGFYGKEYSYYGGSAEFKYLSEKYGDTSFNQVAVWGIVALSEAIVSIEVVALSDYDAQHPKGSSLNDITLFYMHETLLEYIQQGYNGNYLKSATYPLSKLPSKGIALANDVFCRLDFTHMPSIKGECSIQVTIGMESGRKLIKTMTIKI